MLTIVSLGSSSDRGPHHFICCQGLITVLYMCVISYIKRDSTKSPAAKKSWWMLYTPHFHPLRSRTTWLFFCSTYIEVQSYQLKNYPFSKLLVAHSARGQHQCISPVALFKKFFRTCLRFSRDCKMRVASLVGELIDFDGIALLNIYYLNRGTELLANFLIYPNWHI